MNTRIESTLTLEEAAEHIGQWRRRKKKGERIPEQLWSEAIALVANMAFRRSPVPCDYGLKILQFVS